MRPMSLSVSILSARGTTFGRFFVSLRQEGEYAFSKKSGQDKNVIDHTPRSAFLNSVNEQFCECHLVGGNPVVFFFYQLRCYGHMDK